MHAKVIALQFHDAYVTLMRQSEVLTCSVAFLYAVVSSVAFVCDILQSVPVTLSTDYFTDSDKGSGLGLIRDVILELLHMKSQVGRISLHSGSLLSNLTCLIIPSSVPDLYWN